MSTMIDMRHEAVLNLMLANACPQDLIDPEKDWYEDQISRYMVLEEERGKTLSYFRFDLHCATAEVVAELISCLDQIQYRIISVRIK